MEPKEIPTFCNQLKAPRQVIHHMHIISKKILTDNSLCIPSEKYF